MIIGGIDPGKKGGLVLYCEGVGLLDLARVVLIKEKNKKEKPNYPLLKQQWTPLLQQCDHVFIEQVGSMPKQGVASSFNFGYVAGVAYGLVLGLDIPHSFVTPQVWKKAVGISGNDGKTSIRRACQLFPSSAEEFARVTVDEGVAEAALIAFAGHKILGDGT